jgi:hypothetical protein
MTIHATAETSMKITSHFKHNVFMLDEAGDLLEHLGGTEDYLLAAALRSRFEALAKRPDSNATRRSHRL